MCGALVHFNALLIFQIAGAKLYLHYAIFLRNTKKVQKNDEKSVIFTDYANRLRRKCVSLRRFSSEMLKKESKKDRLTNSQSSCLQIRMP